MALFANGDSMYRKRTENSLIEMDTPRMISTGGMWHFTHRKALCIPSERFRRETPTSAFEKEAL